MVTFWQLLLQHLVTLIVLLSLNRALGRMKPNKIMRHQQCDQIGRFFAFWATIQSQWQQLFYPSQPTLLGNFCEGVKVILFLVKSLLGNFYRHLAILSGHTGHQRHKYQVLVQLCIFGIDRKLFWSFVFYQLRYFDLNDPST